MKVRERREKERRGKKRKQERWKDMGRIRSITIK
jgi:hypothetical protein